MTATATTTTPKPTTNILNASNVQKVVPEVNTDLAQSHRTEEKNDDLAGYDEEQIRLMDEVCIVLDEDDNPIGSASKKVCTWIAASRRGWHAVLLEEGLL